MQYYFREWMVYFIEFVLTLIHLALFLTLLSSLNFFFLLATIRWNILCCSIIRTFLLPLSGFWRLAFNSSPLARDHQTRPLQFVYQMDLQRCLHSLLHHQGIYSLSLGEGGVNSQFDFNLPIEIPQRHLGSVYVSEKFSYVKNFNFTKCG